MTFLSAIFHIPSERTFFAYAALLNSITAAILVAIVVTKSRHREQDVTFGALCGSVAWWNFFYFLWMASITAEQARLFKGLVMFCGSLTPLTFFHFVSNLCGTRDRYRKYLKGAYAWALFIGVLGPTRLIIADFKSIMIFPYWPVPGPLLGLEMNLTTLIVAIAFWDLFSTFKKVSGIKREQIRYTLVSSLVAVPGSMMNYLPWYGIHIKPYGNIFLFAQLAVISYAILRYRLIDVNLATRNVLIYFLFASIFSGPLLMAVWLTQSRVMTGTALVLGVLLAPVLFRRLRDSLEQTVDKIPVFGKRYAGFRTLQSSLTQLEKSQSIEEWTKRVVGAVQGVFPVKVGSLMLWDEGQAAYIIKAGWGLSVGEMSFLSLSTEGSLVRRLQAGREIVMAELVKESLKEIELKAVMSEFSFIHAAVSIPIVYETHLTAILNLGPMPDGRMFNELELANLDNLMRTAEHSLRMVLSGTEKLRNTALLAHDLVKPFTSKGSLRRLMDLAEGRLGELSEEAKKSLRLAISDFNFVGQHLKEIIRPEKTNPVEMKSSSMTGIYHRTMEKYEASAKERKIQLHVYFPLEDVRVLCDLPLIEHRVIANLMDNAFRHTPDGGKIELGSRVEKGTFVGYVRDNGPGIDIKDQGRIFNYGAQLEKSRAGEAGLGLYSVKSIIEASGGILWVESEKGRGSCFYFQLKLA